MISCVLVIFLNKPPVFKDISLYKVQCTKPIETLGQTNFVKPKILRPAFSSLLGPIQRHFHLSL